jgi:hypothetical protein
VVGGIHATIYRDVVHGKAAELPALLPALSYFATAPFVGHAAALAGPTGIRADAPPAVAPCAAEPEIG